MPDDATLPQLRALADEGARLAHGMSGARVRARGQRRHRRRILTSAVAASAIVAALVGGAFAAIDQLTNPAEPSSAGPVQTVGPSTTPDPVLLTAEQTRRVPPTRN
jgi:hypothetical protein